MRAVPRSTPKRLPLAVSALVVLAASLLLAAVAQPAVARAAALKMIWGSAYLPEPPAANDASAFPIYHELGVNVFQTELLWNEVAPTRPRHPTNPNDPAYQWPSDLSFAVQQAARYGIKVSVLVQWSPSWASGQRAPQWAPIHARDFANFVTAAARRYPSVHFWMIWGEPTRPGNFLPMPGRSPVGPRRYALVLNAAYHALKRVSRSNIVIGGDTTSVGTVMPPAFIRWMRLPNGKPPPLDYYGHNPYGDCFPGLNDLVSCPGTYPGTRDINGLRALHRQLVRTYHHQVKLWLSEFGINNTPNSAFGFYTSLEGQAQWLTAAYNVVNSVNYVAGLGWFNLVDDPPGVYPGLTMGLMTWNLHRKPAFYAYQHAP